MSRPNCDDRKLVCPVAYYADRQGHILEATRSALKALLDNEFAYLHLLAAIEGEVDDALSHGREPSFEWTV